MAKQFIDTIENWIKFEDCKEGYLYKIEGRNGRLGIFQDHCFYILCYQFGKPGLEMERHFDTHVRYGTVKPIQVLGYVGKLDYDEMLELLKDKNY